MPRKQERGHSCPRKHIERPNRGKVCRYPLGKVVLEGRACESESSKGATEFSPRRQPWVPAKKSSQAPTGRHKKIRSGMSVAPLGLMIFTARNPGLTPRAIPSRPFGALMNRRQVCPPPLGQAHFGVLRQSGASTELSRFICSRCAVFGWLDGINRELRTATP